MWADLGLMRVAPHPSWRGSLPRGILCHWKDRSAALLRIAACGLALGERGIGMEAGRMIHLDVLESSSLILGHPEITLSLGKTGNVFSDKL